MDARKLAAEAERLLNEPLLVEALDNAMGDAFAEFKALSIGPDNLHEVIALQQRINVLQKIPELLHAKILASGRSDGGVEIEKKPAD